MKLAIFTVFLVLLQKFARGVPLESMGPVGIAPHIVGGSEAPEGHAPHMIALVFGEVLISLVCGGSIISEECVLTAAHCIDAVKNWNGTLMSSLRGVYGSNRWDSTEKRAVFKHYINHENWDPFNIKNDIGVLKTNDKLKLSNSGAASIPLGFDFIEGGEKSYVTGWGRVCAWGPIPARLQLLYVETICHEACVEGVRKAAGGWWAPEVDRDVEVCTLHPEGAGFGMCNGDSGSAIVSLRFRYQFGIVSWGFQCALGAPDMFVRISGFKEWLLKHLSKKEYE